MALGKGGGVPWSCTGIKLPVCRTSSCVAVQTPPLTLQARYIGVPDAVITKVHWFDRHASISFSYTTTSTLSPSEAP